MVIFNNYSPNNCFSVYYTLNTLFTFHTFFSVFLSGSFVYIGETAAMCDENNVLSLRSQSRNIAQYPEIANQSNCATLGGSCVACTK